MKNLQMILLVGAGFLTLPAMAQLVLTKTSSGATKAALHVPPSRIELASSKIKPARIDMDRGKPFVVKLDPHASLNEAAARCGLERAARASLELDGDRRDESSVALEWKTTNGANNLGFDVERSLDDTLHFEKVGYVWAKSFSGMKDRYRLPDANTHSKISFYRLRLLLRNGDYLYSNIAKVAGYTKGSLLVYPNPTVGTLGLLIKADAMGRASVHLYDAAGKVVWQQSSLMNEGRNTRDISVAHLPSGSYRVFVTMADHTIKKATFIKQ